MNDPNRNLLFARAVAEELSRSGVRAVAIAPGSRSGPLALACARQPGLTVFVHLDERSAAFFALGHAKASGAPAAVLTTSGTAAANLLPAAVEARNARVPLVLLTADRPPELRGCGAHQTIDQVRLFGSHALATAELPLPEATGPVLRAARATVCRLVDAAQGPPAGPVHLNVAFREPLDPRPVAGDVPPDLEARDPLAFRGRPGAPFVRIEQPPAEAQAAGAAARFVELARGAARGLIVCGPEAHAPGLATAVGALARASGYPVLADPCSNVRAGAPAGVAVISAYDAILRSERFAAAHAPDLIVRLGAAPVSKALERFVDRHRDRARLAVVDPAPGRVDEPMHLGAEVLRAEPADFARLAAAALAAAGPPPGDPGFADAFERADRRARAALESAAGAAFFEAGIVRALSRALPAGAVLFAGNSLPVRELDSFLPAGERPLHVLANRGASGIDGVVSSALGAVAAGGGAPGALLVGDLSLLHDAGGLLAARRYELPLAIVCIDNDGGGIFSYLPVRENAPAADFEALFATPHGLDLEALARLHGLSFERPEGGEAALEAALGRALARGGPSLVLVEVDREKSAALHRSAWEAAVRAVEGDRA